MSNFKGTKGKWSIELRTPNRNNVNCVNHSVVNEEGFTLMDVWGSDIHPCKTYEEATANALLISKAPEMLEMLEKIVSLEDIICMGGSVGEQWIGEAQALDEMMDKIKQLIKKATEI